MRSRFFRRPPPKFVAANYKEKKMNQTAGRRKSVLKSFLATAFLSAVLASLCTAADGDGARVVRVGKEDVVPVHAKLRFSTLIVLPESEEILDFTTGDKEFWIINGAHNLCYVHPAQAGSKSNLNLITATGHVYSFLLTEISSDPAATLDLKLFVEPKEGASFANEVPLHGYVRAAESEAYKKEIDTIRAQSAEQIRAAKAEAEQQVSKFRADYQSKLQFDYNVDAKAFREPFLVSVIYHDDAFTYIKCAAREKPTLYEVKDGKPSLINFQLAGGVYIVPKILNAGYLAVGKKRMVFARRTSAN
jgi:type IV secretion system protein VirB9